MNRRYTREEDDRIIALRQQGMKWQHIADRLGRSFQSIHHRVQVLKTLRGSSQIRKRAAFDGGIASSIAPLPVRPDPKNGITYEDLAWQRYWRQPRAVRRAQEDAR
ncbi:MAG TPA: hypothetical protein P5330_12005 [Candidatus Competibacteraceae bacterium]|nr:hypothetical protein [Candidatus Competibacteraceae bacterium]